MDERFGMADKADKWKVTRENGRLVVFHEGVRVAKVFGVQKKGAKGWSYVLEAWRHPDAPVYVEPTEAAKAAVCCWREWNASKGEMTGVRDWKVGEMPKP